MLAIGHTHRQAVLIFYLWATVLAGGAVSLAFVTGEAAIVAVAVVMALLIITAVTFSVWPRVRARRLGRQQPAQPEPTESEVAAG